MRGPGASKPMNEPTPIDILAHMIQLSVAPVFLLLAIGSMLAVVTNRLGRVIDRGHFLERTFNENERLSASLQEKFDVLALRAKLANISIVLLTFAALLVCIVIALLFFGALLQFPVNQIVAVLFILSMASIIAGLAFFLGEVRVAVSNLCIGLPH